MRRSHHASTRWTGGGKWDAKLKSVSSRCQIEPLSSAEAAGALGSSVEREELIQLMVAIEILCNPIPERLERSVVQGSLSHPRARGFLSSILSGL